MAYGHPKHHKVSPISAVDFSDVFPITARFHFEELRTMLRLSHNVDAAEECALYLRHAAHHYVAATRNSHGF